MKPEKNSRPSPKMVPLPPPPHQGSIRIKIPAYGVTCKIINIGPPAYQPCRLGQFWLNCQNLSLKYMTNDPAFCCGNKLIDCAPDAQWDCTTRQRTFTDFVLHTKFASQWNVLKKFHSSENGTMNFLYFGCKEEIVSFLPFRTNFSKVKCNKP